MSAEERQRQRKQLEAEVRRPAYRGTLEVLRASVPGWDGLDDWDEIWPRVDRLRLNAVVLDVLVATAVGRLSNPDGNRWNSILLRCLWTHLSRAARRRRRWDKDQIELWQTLVFCLLESANRVHPDAPVPGIARKLLNRSTHRLHDAYRRRWNQLAHERQTDDGFSIQLAGRRDREFARVDARLTRRRHLKRLRSFQQAGRLSPADAVILIVTDVYGMPLRRLTAWSGSPYERLRKRRQRANKKLRGLLRFLSPSGPARGL